MPLVAWGPGWPTDDPDAIAFLFRFVFPSSGELTEERIREPVTADFTIRQARWLLRLRGLLEGPADPHRATLLLYAYAYAIRESVAERLGIPPYFGDLDWAMTVEPWLEERWTLADRLGLSGLTFEWGTAVQVEGPERVQERYGWVRLEGPEPEGESHEG